MIWNMSFKKVHHLFEKGAKFSSNIKTLFQISSWSSCAYIVVLLSKKVVFFEEWVGSCCFSSKNKLLEGDATLSYENELPFHM